LWNESGDGKHLMRQEPPPYPWMEPAEVKAVHRRNLEDVLTKLGVIEPLRRGEFTCDVCGCVITMDNVGTVFKKDGRIHISCNRTDCLAAVLALVKS